jgi:DegV family protein with EDD domain
MSNVEILTDSTSDLLPGEAEGIHVVPVAILIGDSTYYDRVDGFSMEQFYDTLVKRGTTLETQGVQTKDFLQVFEQHPGKFLLVLVGSKLSGATHEAANMAAQLVPEVEMTIYDSETTSRALGMLAKEAKRRSDKQQDLPEIVSALEAMKSKTHLLAALNSLEYIQTGGRFNAGIALAQALKLRGVVAVGENHITRLWVGRSRRHSLNFLVEETLKLGPLAEASVVHAQAYDEAAFVAEQIMAQCQFEDPQPNNIIITEIGPVVARHSGPGVVAVCARQA